MKNNTVPCCYFPTSVVIVDDNKKFLSSLSALLESDTNCQSYTVPSEALAFLAKKANSVGSLLTKQMAMPTEYAEPAKAVVSVDFYEIHKELYEKDIRFLQPVVIIVDYSMPEIDGLAFCKQLKNTAYKKILLTGEADKNLAVDAFNEGNIDRFVMKGDSRCNELLKQYIRELNLKYFVDSSKEIIAASDTLKNILYEPAFCDLFEKIILENNIVEYYLINDSGSFLLLDKDAKPTWLVVQTEEELKMYYDFADAEDDVPVMILEMLDTRERIPFFFQPGSERHHPKTWLLHPATFLGNSKVEIYYAIVKDSNKYRIKQDEVISFSKFLNVH